MSKSSKVLYASIMFLAVATFAAPAMAADTGVNDIGNCWTAGKELATRKTKGPIGPIFMVLNGFLSATVCTIGDVLSPDARLSGVKAPTEDTFAYEKAREAGTSILGTVPGLVAASLQGVPVGGSHDEHFKIVDDSSPVKTADAQ